MRASATARSLLRSSIRAAGVLAATAAMLGTGATAATAADGASAGTAAAGGAAAPVLAPVLDVREFGASGNGRVDDLGAINRAIAAAAGLGGGEVLLPRGTYRSAGSIHLRSRVTLRLAAGATILGGRGGYDPPEPNRWARYADPGHAHFHNALMWGEHVEDVAIIGRGTIDGGEGDLITAAPRRGRADKLISLARCRDLTISGVTLRRGGHFAILTNGCDRITSRGLTIDNAAERDGRDGWDLVNAHDVSIHDITIHSYDDALAFKSDWELGRRLPNGDVTVDGARLSSICCNAVMFGSETCSNMAGYRLSHLEVTGAGKSGLGMVTMDGARISDVRYSDVRMSGVAGPFMEKVGARRRCGGHPGVGSISHVTYAHVEAVSPDVYTAALWGRPGHWISDVRFEDLRLILTGSYATVPELVPVDDPLTFDPDSIGPRPASGIYMHDVRGVSLRDSTIAVTGIDPRPAVDVQDGSRIELGPLRLQDTTASSPELVVQGVAHARAQASEALTGAAVALARSPAPEWAPPCIDCSLYQPLSQLLPASEPAPPPPVTPGAA